MKDWYLVLNTEFCEDKFRLLMMELTSAIDSFLPRKIVKKHPTDCPWISEKDNLHFSDMERTLQITNFGGTRSRARSKKLKVITIMIKLLKWNPLIPVSGGK